MDFVLLRLFFLFVVLAHADTASDIYPNSSSAWHKKAYDLQKAKKFDETLTVINQAIELNQNDGYAPKTKNGFVVFK